MINAIEINNFQSIHHLDIELGNFTVIVGPTNVGKSAFMRAMRTLTSNARGTNFITTGQRICTIKAITEDGTVTLKRGKATDDNEYTVVPAYDDHRLAPQKTWTKLNATVPEEVSEFIGIEAANPINYAGQFDSPYLLDPKAGATGGEVARVLGALTNVNIIFEGARESNRRKLASASTLKTRAGDLAAIMAKVPTFKPLKTQREHLAQAEQHLATAERVQRNISRLTAIIDTMETKESLSQRLGAIADVAIPDASRIPLINQQLAKLKGMLVVVSEQRRASVQAAQQVIDTDHLIDEQREKYSQSLGQLAGAIATYYLDKATTLADDSHPQAESATIEVWEATQLAADYIVEALG
jgi:predicted ATPase